MIFDFDTSHSYLKEILRAKSAKNPTFSLRAMAQQIGISPSALSEYLNAKKTISTDSALRIVQWLKLKEKESEYFTTLVQLESVKSLRTKSELTKKIADLKPLISEEDSLEIKNLINLYTMDSVAAYSDGALNGRTLVLLKDKVTGKRVRTFFESLFFIDRFISYIIYFIENPNGRFTVYQNQVLGGENKLSRFLKNNRSLKITFDKDGYPKVHGLTVFTAGTNRYSLCDLTYTKNKATIRGRYIDQERPEDFIPTKNDYTRL